MGVSPNPVYLRRFYPQINADERRFNVREHANNQLFMYFICVNLRPSADQYFSAKATVLGVPPVWALVWQRKPVSKQARRLFSLLFATEMRQHRRTADLTCAGCS
jgi:hypothetical protein